MITPTEAETIILREVPMLSTEDCPLEQALGRVLRAPVLADRDGPPFDRVTMDGYAVRASENSPATRRLTSLGFQAAGIRPWTIADAATCVEIATGAVLPLGADYVVPYEETSREGETIFVNAPARFSAGANVHRRASDHLAGERLVQPGARLGSREIAVAAACGAVRLRVTKQPRVAVIATGDELVAVDAANLAPHQIRRSNDAALRAALIMAGFGEPECYHLRDTHDELRTTLRRVLAECDAVVLTGGVSKGKLDLLPAILTELGVVKKFHGVAQRPGKPFWFGISARTTPIFALPGNPVSTYTCFTRYVLPALLKMSGAFPKPASHAALAEKIVFQPQLSFFLPVRIESKPTGQQVAHPSVTNTSGDLGGLIGSDGFLELPAEESEFPAGQIHRYYPWA